MKTNNSLTRILLILFIATMCAGFAARTARGQNVPPNLAIDLYVSDERILIYAGAENGLQKGQRFSVVRYGSQVALIELSEVRSVSSIARIITKLENVRNMDQLVPVGSYLARGGMKPETPAVDYSDKKVKASETPAVTSTTAAAETKPAEKETKEKPAAKKDTKAKKDDKKTTSEKKPAAKKDTAKDKTEEKEPAAKKDTKAKKDDKKTDAKKDEKAAAPAAAVPTDPRAYAFTTSDGFTGLWTIPTTDILPKGKTAFSWYRGWYSVSASAMDYDNSIFTGKYVDIEKTSFALTYGLTRNVEVGAAQSSYDLDSMYSVSNPSSDSTMKITGDGDVNIISVKYNPTGKRYFLEPTTHKKWSYAAGAQWIGDDNSDKDSTYIYGIMMFPAKKFDLTAGIFHYNTQDMIGKKLGTMAGIEIPMNRDLILIGEATLFQSEYTYNFAVRYIYKKSSSLLLGMSDATDLRFKEAGLSFTF